MAVQDPLVYISWFEEGNTSRVNELPPDLRDRVLSLTYIDKAKKADECKIVMSNGDLKLFSDTRLAEGNKLQVSWGYENNMSSTKIVTIKKVTGWSKLSFDCVYSKQLDFIASQQSRSWSNVTAAEVAEELANEMGYRNSSQKVITESDIARRHEGIMQTGETKYAFLSRIARAEDYVFLIKDNVFHFHPPRLDVSPSITLTYFDSDRGDFIGEPSLEEGTLGIPVRVRRSGHSNQGRTGVEGEASNETDRGEMVLGQMATFRTRTQHGAVAVEREVTQADIDRHNPQEVVNGSSSTTDEDATNRARRNRRRAGREAIKLSATIIGIPNLKADETIRLEGLPEKMVGNYYLEQVDHSVGKGYTCKIKLKRNATSRSSGGRMSAQRGEIDHMLRIQVERTRLGVALANGSITKSQFDEEMARFETMQARIRANAAGGESQGQVNDLPSPADDELVQNTRFQNGRQVTTYERRPQTSGVVTQSGRPRGNR